MPAPSTDQTAPTASTSSSGYTDGLGRRSLVFDRGDGVILERLIVRPELAAFEPALRERVERVAALEDERVARPRAIDRDADGTLVLTSEFVPGSRLTELLDTASQQGAVPGVDVALGYLVDVLGALHAFHSGAGFAHGAMSPGRTILTASGQVVLLDAIFGDALARLQYSRRRLWNEFGIAMSPCAGPARFDRGADVTQAAVAALSLVIGRPLGTDDYPTGLPALLLEVVDVAMIRGSAEFAAGLQRFLQRALPLAGGRPYASAADALLEIQPLAIELGVDVCRRALVDFIEQMESAGDEGAAYDADSMDADSTVVTDDTAERLGLSVDEGDDEDEESYDAAEETSDQEDAVYDLSAAALGDAPLSIDAEPEPATPAAFDPLPAAEPPPAIVFEPRVERAPAAVPAPVDPPPVAWEPEPQPEPEPVPAPELAVVPEPVLSAAEADPNPPAPPAAPEPEPVAVAEAPADPVSEFASELKSFEYAVEAGSETVEDEPSEAAPASVHEPAGSRRKKRAARSARARKDKLRSTAPPPPSLVRSQPPPQPAPPAPAPPAPAPPAPAAEKPSRSGWLVPPERAGAFEPPVPDVPAYAAAPPPPPAIPFPAPAPAAPPPPVALTPPAPPVVMPPPAVHVPVTQPGSYGTTMWSPPTAPAASQPVPPAPIAPQASTLRLKEPIGVAAKPRAARPQAPAGDIYSAPARPDPAATGSRGFPWKLAAAAAVVLAIGGAAAGGYIPGRSSPTAAAPAPKPAPAPTTAPAAAPPVRSIAANTGRIEIETQPAGAKVLVDGKPAGESPLALDAIPAGRHTLTFISTAGSVRRTIRVEAGKTLKVDVPIFSGWVGIFAPIVLEVAEDGRAIGTTEESRLMLAPGRHELTLTNRELGYTSIQTVDIEPGEVRSLTIDPRGSVNFNATPWAEVWIDGKKVGETPLANLPVTLGVREIVFKNQQFGERRVTITVKANEPAAVSIDMSKQ